MLGEILKLIVDFGRNEALITKKVFYPFKQFSNQNEKDHLLLIQSFHPSLQKCGYFNGSLCDY